MFHIYFYVLSELIRMLKPPSSPVSWGLYQSESHGLKWDHHLTMSAKRENIHVQNHGFVGWITTVLGWIPLSQIGKLKKKSAAYMHKHSLFQKTIINSLK